MKVSASKRLQLMTELLQENGFVKAKELSQRFGVSMETIRKDLTFLEDRGVAKKEYGGAALSLLGVETGLELRMNHEDHKKAIARYTAGLLREYHSVIIDSGSTCLACVQYINLLPSMDIITNSLEVCRQLDGSRHNVFMLPGKKREKSRSVTGNWAEIYLKGIYADVCLLGTSGLLDAWGPTSHSYQELSTKQMMLSRSSLTYVLADSSKFQENGFHTIAGWDQVDGIITDQGIPMKAVKAFSEKVKIHIAKEDEVW